MRRRLKMDCFHKNNSGALMDVANCTSMKKCRSEKLRHFQSTDKLLQTQKFPEQLLEKLKFLLTSSTRAAKSVTYVEAVAPLQRPAGATSPRWNPKDSRGAAGTLLRKVSGAYYVCALICSPRFLVLQGFSASGSLLTLLTS